jgi:hypothetical protein
MKSTKRKRRRGISCRLNENRAIAQRQLSRTKATQVSSRIDDYANWLLSRRGTVSPELNLEF